MGNDSSRETRFDAWVQAATKFFVLANAGAAVATLSFMATRPLSSGVQVIDILALTCFVAGIFVARLTIMGQLTAAWRGFLSANLPPEAVETAVSKGWVTRYSDKAEPRTADGACVRPVRSRMCARARKLGVAAVTT